MSKNSGGENNLFNFLTGGGHTNSVEKNSFNFALFFFNLLKKPSAWK